MAIAHYPDASERRRQLEDALRAFVDVLVNQLGAKKVVLFGSLATGNVHPDSDIDLFVIQDTSLGYYERLTAALMALRPTVALDLVIFTPREVEASLRTGNRYLAEILREGRVLHEG